MFVLAILMAVLCIGVVSADSFYISVGVSGHGSGTIVNTVTSPVSGEGTAFCGKDMSFKLTNTMYANLATLKAGCNRHTYIVAKRLMFYDSYVYMGHSTSISFSVFNAKHTELYYKDGMTFSTKGVVGYRNITLKARTLGWHTRYNLETTESFYNGEVSHTFTTLAKAHNLTFTDNSKVTVGVNKFVTTNGNYGKLSYHMTYKASKMTGQLFNFYKYYETGGNTYVKGTYKNFTYVYGVNAPLIYQPVY